MTHDRLPRRSFLDMLAALPFAGRLRMPFGAGKAVAKPVGVLKATVGDWTITTPYTIPCDQAGNPMCGVYEPSGPSTIRWECS